MKGIGAWLGSAATAAANLATSAYNALRKALDEHSPSRKSRKSGKNFDLGLGGGIKDNADYAIDAAESMSEGVLDALDVDKIGLTLAGINVPETMERINSAIDDKHFQVAERVIAITAAKERSESVRNRENSNFEFDYKRLAKELSNRPIYVSAQLNGRELVRETAIPMEQMLQENSKLKSMINGGRT